ncbi:hypothetical protein [Stenotrophomonas sp. Iso1]|uniref:hypothetical protein n=1 Tax=Stenotrophomonas sp. Iso1 TaxID=2977283 RepID=UPI0022B78846|nr:hypothetical protein [Stenotrophomonas sp. Iso1]
MTDNDSRESNGAPRRWIRLRLPTNAVIDSWIKNANEDIFRGLVRDGDSVQYLDGGDGAVMQLCRVPFPVKRDGSGFEVRCVDRWSEKPETFGAVSESVQQQGNEMGADAC